MSINGKVRVYLHLHLANGIGSRRFQQLIQAVDNPEKILSVNKNELRDILGNNRAAKQIYEGIQTVDPEKELKEAEELGVRIISFEDEEYPELLRQIPDFPPILYLKGNLSWEDNLALAVVGTRRPSRYGAEQASRFAYILSQMGFTIVSGLARGIDSSAHRGTLLGNGKTIAVLGCGLKRIYPPENEALASKILEKGGALISEYPLDTEPLACNFPMRNRIVAGISVGTLVVEAPLNSGALTTANLSIEYNREVFAIPGPIDNPNFVGSNRLIQEGKAKLVIQPEDILDELGKAGEMLKSQAGSVDMNINSVDDMIDTNLSEEERKIWQFLKHGPADIDTICTFCNLPPAKISALLTLMEIKGIIKKLPGNQFTRK